MIKLLNYLISRKDVFFLIVISLFSRGLNFFSIAWLAKHLDVVIFGTYSSIVIFSSLLTSIVGFGITSTATKLISEAINCDRRKLHDCIDVLYKSIIILTSLSCLLFLILFTAFDIFEEYSSIQIDIFIMILVVVFLDNYIALQNSLILAVNRIKWFNSNTLFFNILLNLMLFFLALKYGLFGIMVSMIVSRLFLLFINSIKIRLYFAEIEFKFNAKLNLNYFGFLKISIPSYFSSISSNIINSVGMAIILGQPNGLKSYASYSIANHFRTIITLIPENLSKVLTPRLLNIYSDSYSRSSFNKYFYKNILIILFLSVSIAIFLYISRDIISVYFENKFDLNELLILSILTTSVLINVSNLFATLFLASDNYWIDFFLRLISGLILIFFLYFCTSDKGANGLSYAYLVSSFVYFILQFSFWKMNINKR